MGSCGSGGVGVGVCLQCFEQFFADEADAVRVHFVQEGEFAGFIPPLR
jgi:hypothetical protein